MFPSPQLSATMARQDNSSLELSTGILDKFHSIAWHSIAKCLNRLKGLMLVGAFNKEEALANRNLLRAL